MTNQEDRSDWPHLYLQLGQLVVAAGRVESAMHHLARALQRRAGMRVRVDQPPWSKLVKRIRKASKTVCTDQVSELLEGVEDLGRRRNIFIHGNWTDAGSEGHWLQRVHPFEGKPPLMIHVHAQVLDDDIARMERLSANMHSLTRALREK